MRHRPVSAILLSFLSAAVLGFPAASAHAADPPAATASASVVDLSCEYLQDPLGIDAREPRLSWRLVSNDPAARGLRQTAYQVLVSSTPQQLAQDEGDLWDSGEVASGQSVHVVYGGRPLASRTRCFWKVRVRDHRTDGARAGAMSAWSKPARWTMGLLEPGDWKAQWIGVAENQPAKAAKSAENSRPDPWLRKSFSLPVAPERATVYVASIGYHELFVNGVKVGDAVLEPVVTDHSKRARYVTYEIADKLHAGKNVIGLWLGVSWSIYPYYKTADKPQAPIVIAQAEITLGAGREGQSIVTDATWKTHASPNMLLGTWNFTNFGGEIYDARKELPGWCEAGLDDSAWKPAAVFSPRLTLSAQVVEPNRRVKALRPVAIEERPGGEFRVDMGVNYAGFVEIDVHGKPGQRIDLQFSERPNQAMTHRLRSAYILGPTGKGTFRNRFNYSVGRWITIKGLDAKPAPEDIRGHLVRTDYRPAADFECSNKLLNDIYRMTLWTFENLSLGGYVVDCPQRERMGYGGDAHATTETAMNSYHVGAFYTKWAQDWRDVQGKSSAWGVGVKAGQPGAGDSAEEGNLPYTAPTYWGGGGPGWSGYCVTLPWLMYRQYGDVRILEVQFPTIQRWLRFLESKSSKDMLVRWGGQWDFLGDWLWPGAKGVNGDTPETLFFNNCYWIYNLQTAARIADVLGKRDAAAAYRQRAEAVRRAVHARFFRPEDNSYVNGFQAYLSIALFVGLPRENLRPAVSKRLEDEILVRRKGHIHAGITGGYFVIKELVDAGRDDLIYAMATKEDYPSWGDMLRRGATTFWESWEGDISLLHSSYLHLGLWFVEGLGGIQPDPERPGFQSFVIRPGILPGRLDWVKARYESLYGPITSQWKIEGGKLRLTVQVPPNTTARLLLPAKDAGSIRESGRPAAGSVGVKPLGTQDGRAVFQLGSGRYEFESSL
jgi:alpha-L-rhamnosidase